LYIAIRHAFKEEAYKLQKLSLDTKYEELILEYWKHKIDL